MSAHCHDHHAPAADNAAYRRVLWVALVLNASMFVVEIVGGVGAHSSALLADAIDFAGDAANYGLSLFVLGMSLSRRAGAALLKGLSMGAFGLLVLGQVAWAAFIGTPPEPLTMGVIGAAALAVNVGVALLLFGFRNGDANRRSVWLCTRNDALGNIAVLAAALGVLGTASRWPDLIVATGMAGLALHSSVQVVRQASRELAVKA